MLKLIQNPTNDTAQAEFPTPLNLPELPTIFRVASLRTKQLADGSLEVRAALYHDQASLTVRWSTRRLDARLTVNSLVSPRWPVRMADSDGGIPVLRLVPLQRPEGAINLFRTVPTGWVKDRGLVAQAAALVDELPGRYRHLLNALLWDGDRFRRFCHGPSSKQHHHSHEHGNLAHSVDVATLMRELCRMRLAADAEMGILLGMIHDIGKADEYRLNSRGQWVMTETGYLLGHDFTRDQWIAEAFAANRLGITQKERLRIQHCLSAKQHAPDWLGMRRPVMPEAFLLSHADRMSGEVGEANR